MIISDKAKLTEEITRIDEALHKCSQIYLSCTNTTKLTTNLDNKIKVDKDKLEQLVVIFDGIESLTSFVDGQNLLLESEISALEKENDKLMRWARELRGSISPQLNTLLLHKWECMDQMNMPTPATLTEEELHAYILNGFVSILGTLKTEWDTYLAFLKGSYLDIFKYIQIR